MFTKELGVALDFTRVIACLMVVMLHVSGPGVSEFTQGWIYSEIYQSLVRVCVPLFLMLSGALLLSRGGGAIDFYKKRFVRVFPPLIFWSIFYICWKSILNGDITGLMGAFASALAGPAYYHLWYLYALIGIYLFIPFMSQIYRASTEVEKIIYLIIWFVVACVFPTVSYFFPAVGDLAFVYGLSSFVGLSGYVFLGAFCFERIRARGCPSVLSSACGYMLCVLCTALATYWLSMKDGTPNQFMFRYLAPFVVIGSFFGFRLLITLGVRLSRYANPLSVLAGCTLGVYCLHVFVMNRLSLFYGALIEGHSVLWVTPLLVAVIFIATLIPIFIARLFKPLRQII